MKRFTIILIAALISVGLYRFVYRVVVFLMTDTGTRHVMGKAR